MKWVRWSPTTLPLYFLKCFITHGTYWTCSISSLGIQDSFMLCLRCKQCPRLCGKYAQILYILIAASIEGSHNASSDSLKRWHSNCSLGKLHLRNCKSQMNYNTEYSRVYYLAMGQGNNNTVETLFIKTMYMMPYHSTDGTSKCCLVARECAMSCIRSCSDLCHANRSTISGMSCFINMDKGLTEIDFCGNPAISIMIDEHDHTIEKVRNLKYTGGLIIASLVPLWDSTEDQLVRSSYIHALKWQTRNGVVQMQSPEFGDIVIHHLSSPCIELIFVRHSINYGNMISLRTQKVILSLTCFPIWIVIFLWACI